MRITYRHIGVRQYWTERWADIPADSPMANTQTYPLKYALETVDARDGAVLEAGCGAGRILRYFHQHGYDITGIDYIEVAIEKLRKVDPSLKIETGDITRLHYADGRFRYVLAFGLYHNLEDGLENALAETLRVLMPGGRLCASFRADNLHTQLTDWLADRAKRRSGGDTRAAFHKLNLSKSEFRSLVERAGFVIESVRPVENMPILYKFSCFRSRGHKRFNESKARGEGYRLSPFGQWLQDLLMRLFPDQFCNIYVLIAHRP